MPDTAHPAQTPRCEIHWKLLFHQLFAQELRKERGLLDGSAASEEALDALLRRFSHYHPGSFNDALDVVLRAGSSERAYQARKRFFENPVHRRDAAVFDLARTVGPGLWEQPRVRDFLQTVEQHRARGIAAGENFFDSPEGQNVVQAFAQNAAGEAQEVAFVLVPGYAGHAVKWYIFEEIVRDANRYHGRPADRPLLREDGLDLEFEDHATYYARGRSGQGAFDVLHPTGQELGNTTGFNAESTERLRDWLVSLPEAYAGKKLIILGYSKGAPAVLDLVNRHPELSERVLGYVSFAGVLQGTGVARDLLEQARALLGDMSLGEFMEQLRDEDAQSLASMLSPLFAHLDLSILSWDKLATIFDILELEQVDLERLRDSGDRREVRELLDGALDLTPEVRARWNLTRLHDGVFQHPCFVMQLSVLTDLKSFVQPGVPDDAGHLDPGPLIPRFNAEGQLDWSSFSLDALFLYATSLDGFKGAEAGLFDTQVELANTKLPMLDRRPLNASLTADELDSLWSDPEVRSGLEARGVVTREQFGTTPRRDLYPQESTRHVHAVDLGEVKGHHWIPFVQALRPPSERSGQHAVWDFPRKAYMRALLQVLALYNLTAEKVVRT